MAGWLITQSGAHVQLSHVEALVPEGNRVVAWLRSGRTLTVVTCTTEQEALEALEAIAYQARVYAPRLPVTVCRLKRVQTSA